MWKRFKEFIGKLSQSIYLGEREIRQMNIIKRLGYIVIVAGTITTVMNIIEHRGAVTYATIGVMLLGITITVSISVFKKKKVALWSTWIMSTIIFSYFAISGANEGFAILWTLLVPLALGYIGGILYSFTACLYYEIFFIVIFYTPVNQYISDIYTLTFQQRYPILYLTSVFINSVTLVSSHMSTLAQFDYEKKLKEALDIAEQESERARVANEAKSAFLSNMSHEIRTPINAVLGMNEMIMRESGEDDIIQYSASIKNAGHTLLSIINDILDFSKIEAGKMEIIPVDYNITSLINDLVNMIQTRADAKGLELVLDIDPDTPMMFHGDEIRIKQIITNILTNAVKYAEKGSVKFSVTFERLMDDPNGANLCVSVRDTGIGIKPEDLSRLFSEFERIEEKRNRNVEGTGLGMNITKRLLEMMGSALKVESVYGEGSCFSFKLRQTVQKWDSIGDYQSTYGSALKERTVYKEKFTAPDAHVLVVDDNDMNLIVFKNLLKKTLIKVDTACDGDEGLAASRKTKYDLIFLDHMMPGKDGIETLHLMLEEKDNPNILTPKVCLTANAISGARDEYIKAGFDDYLTKPIDSDHLESLLLEYLPKELTGGGARAAVETAASCKEKIEENKAENKADDGLASLRGQKLIDIDCGIKNSGSADAYIPLLKVFYDSIEEKAAEIERFYASEDYKNYTIKVHALKSSARIIGATEFGEEAQKLENAGKADDIGYIREHHGAFMSEYSAFKGVLSPMFSDGTSSEEKSDKPVADPGLMEDFYSAISDAAGAMDLDTLEAAFEEMKEYSVPDSDIEIWNKVKAAFDSFDYEGMVNIIASRTA